MVRLLLPMPTRKSLFYLFANVMIQSRLRWTPNPGIRLLLPGLLGPILLPKVFGGLAPVFR